MNNRSFFALWRNKLLAGLAKLKVIPDLPFCGNELLIHKLRPYSQAIHNRDSFDYHMAMIRMYAHAIDKGLSRTDWEYGRSSKAIALLQESIPKCEQVVDDSLVWAKSVLSRYEERAIGKTSHLPPHEEVALTKSPESLFAAMRRRASNRAVDDRDVPEALIHEITRAALEAPSSCHRQTLVIQATNDKKVAAEIGSCFKGFTGFSSGVPLFLVFCADLSAYTFPSELFTPAIDTALAAQNAMLLASEYGISLTPLNWTGRPTPDRKLRTLLKIPDHHGIFLGAAGGFVSTNLIRPSRKSSESTLVIHKAKLT